MWFIETPWPPIAICAGLALLLYLFWLRNARTLYLCGIGGLVVASVAIFFVEQQIVTELERVEESVYRLAVAVEKNDTEAVLSFFADNTLEQHLMRFGISSELERIMVDGSIRITDLRSEQLGEGAAAQIVIRFRGNGSVTLKPEGQYSGRFSTHWKLTWEKQTDDEWRIVNVVRLATMNDKEIGLTDPQI